jgi:Zn-dependent protease
VIGMAVLINLTFFLFNIIPWPPLDGSRLLYAFAPQPLQDAMRNIERSGLMSLAVFFLIFYTLLSGPFFILVSNLMSNLAPGFTTFLGI